MRRMTGGATFRLHRRVFIRKWSLLVHVTLNAGRIRARRQASLLRLEPAMRIVTIAATHGPFQNFVVERSRELRLDLGGTAGAKLRVIRLQHSDRGKARLFSIGRGHQEVRAGDVRADFVRVGRVAIGTPDIVPPVLSAAEVVPLFFARVAGKTYFGGFFRRPVCKADYL